MTNHMANMIKIICEKYEIRLKAHVKISLFNASSSVGKYWNEVVTNAWFRGQYEIYFPSFFKFLFLVTKR